MLNLTMNKMTCIPTAIGSLKKLEILKMASNKIVTIPDSLSDHHLQTTLVKLWLPNNLLQQIPLSFSRLTAIKSVMLDGNPLVCPPGMRCPINNIYICISPSYMKSFFSFFFFLTQHTTTTTHKQFI